MTEVGSMRPGRSRTRIVKWLVSGAVLAVVALLPSSVFAQSSIAGVVRDASGAVLPGVTVEAASPALIEKVRTAVTDGTGQYRLENLRPGSYTLTFSLTGFAQVKRENVEVSGGSILSINADLRVGGVQETITVSGETPVVDVQTSTKKQTVLDDSVIEALPSSRGYGNLLSAVPGIQNNSLDNGTNPTMVFFTAHGGRGNEGTVQIDGMNVGASFNGGGVSSFGYPTQSAAEVQVTVVGGLGETDRGGPAFNIVPKTGGNTFSGEAFQSYAGDWSYGNNIDARQQAFIPDVPTLHKNWDSSFALGGPIVKDKLWFYGNLRSFGIMSDVAGQYGNKNAGDPNAWSYVEDRGIQARNANDKKIAAIRLTGQLTPRNKLGFYEDYQKNCTGSSYEKGGKQCRDRGDDWIALNGGFNNGSPESGNVWDDREKIIQASWTSPVTNKLLLEAGLSSLNSRWGGTPPAGALLDFIPVVELVAHPGGGVPLPFYAYRSQWSFFGNNYGLDQQHNVWRASMSYVTGSHNLKVGYGAGYLVENQTRTSVNSGIQNYLFFDGFPISLTQEITEPRLGQPRPLRRHLPPGSVDAQPPHRAGRGALRARVELVPRRRHERHHDRDPLQRRADSLPEDHRREGLQRHHPAAGPRLRRVRQRQDLVQGQFQQVPAAGQQRERVHVGQPVGVVRAEHRSQLVRRQHQLCGRLQSQRSQRQRRVRSVGQPELREVDERHHRESGDPRGVGFAAVRLAVRRVAAAGTDAACLGDDQLQPADVGQLLLHRQPRGGTQRLRQGDDHGAAQRRSPGRRWVSGVVFRRQGSQVRPVRQLLHVRQGLRRRDLLLARPGLRRERPLDQRREPADRRLHRPRRPRHV